MSALLCRNGEGGATRPRYHDAGGVFRGTNGSNPASSSGELGANLTGLRNPLPSGWRHRKFWTRSPMSMAFAVKDGAPSMRFATHDSASMLFRHVDIDLAAYL